MIRYLLILPIFFYALVSGLGLSASSSAFAAEMGIAAIVNEDAISLDDFNDRMTLIITSSRLPNDPKTRKKLAPQVVGSLIEEQLMLQEAQKHEISVTQAEIDNGFVTIAQQNNIEAERFKKALAQNGVNLATMERQIEAQIAWSKVVQKRLRSKVSISESDIDSVVERLSASAGKTEYLVSEILLSTENAPSDAEARELAGKLVQQVRAGKAPFGRLAQQFSSAPGAPQGGSLGWVQEGQMASEIDAVITALDEGEVSDPIRTVGGYHILQLRKKRVISPETIPPRDEIKASIGNERLERAQRRHLMDLRSAAFIERRLGS